MPAPTPPRRVLVHLPRCPRCGDPVVIDVAERRGRDGQIELKWYSWCNACNADTVR